MSKLEKKNNQFNKITLKLHKPAIKELSFRKKLLSDPITMSYNQHWGGVVDFCEEKWEKWYNHWIINHKNKRFYRYLLDGNGEFIGEIAYRLDEEQNMYFINILIDTKYRKKGYGNQGLKLLIEVAKENNIKYLYDSIAIDNNSISLFLKNGFIEKYRTEDSIILEKRIK